MNLHRRLLATLILISSSLFPRTTDEPSTDISDASTTIFIRQEHIPSYLAIISRQTTESRTGSLIFPGVFPLAAPFLLFRLKRLGYTSRIECGNGALRLIVRR